MAGKERILRNFRSFPGGKRNFKKIHFKIVLHTHPTSSVFIPSENARFSSHKLKLMGVMAVLSLKNGKNRVD